MATCPRSVRAQNVTLHRKSILNTAFSWIKVMSLLAWEKFRTPKASIALCPAHLVYFPHSNIITFKRFIQILWSLQRVIQLASCDQFWECKIVANLGNGVKHYLAVFWAKKCAALVAVTSSKHEASYVLYIHSVVAKRCTSATQRDCMFVHITGMWAKGQEDLEWKEDELEQKDAGAWQEQHEVAYMAFQI